MALLCVWTGCDGIWDLEPIRVDAAPPADAARPDSTVPTDMIAWFPMDSVASGSVPELVTGANGECTGSSCPTPTPGRVGDALLFDGTAQLVTSTPAAALNTASSFTVAAWVRIDLSMPEGFACAVNKRYGQGTFNTWQLCSFFDQWRFASVNDQLVGPNIDLGVWHHFAATWNQTTTELQLNVDGVAFGPPVFTTVPFDDGRLVIGADVDDGGVIALFPGAIDDVRVYGRALSAEELTQLATVK